MEKMKRRSFLRGAAALFFIPSINFLEKIGIVNEKSWIVSLVRKSYPVMIAEQLVGVQPMIGPVGEIFNLRYEWTGELHNWGEFII
jgi:hypothetical protein